MAGHNLFPQPVAVVDIETTGKDSPKTDRVVELAAVVLDEGGRVVREFVTLVNPERDVGPTWLHGVTARDVLYAPVFAEIAPTFVDWLDGIGVWAAHNASFDKWMLEGEFGRLDASVPEIQFFCTMRPFGHVKLADCCEQCAVAPPRVGHSALEDARATARLLVAMTKRNPDLREQLRPLAPINWPAFDASGRSLCTRDESRAKQRSAPCLLFNIVTQLAHRVSAPTDDAANIAYLAMLNRAVADLVVDDLEAHELHLAAVRLGLGGENVRQLHDQYLHEVLAYALSDGFVSDIERTELHKLAMLLGHPDDSIDRLIVDSQAALGGGRPRTGLYSTPDPGLVGKTVCFTGDLNAAIQGKRIDKDRAGQLAVKQGLLVDDAVTKKRLDLLVVADEYTQSAKREKAEKWGIPVIAEPVFWRRIGVHVD